MLLRLTVSTWKNLKHPYFSTNEQNIIRFLYDYCIKEKIAVENGQSVTCYNRSSCVHVNSQLGKHTHGRSEGLCPSREPYLTVQ